MEIYRKYSEYEGSLAQPAENAIWPLRCYLLTADCVTEAGGPDWSNIGCVLRDWYGIRLTPELHRAMRALTNERAAIRSEEWEEKRKHK